MRRILVLWGSKVINGFLEKRAGEIFSRISAYIKKKNRILDIGVGSSHVTKLMIDSGFRITPLDVINLSYFNDIKPIIYDGKKIPFADNEFDVSLLITVLHHAKDPKGLLKEAVRVSRKIIIVEDIYRDSLQKYLTYLMDSIGNLEFFGHPHNNKSDEEWKGAFKELNLNLKDARYYPFWKFFMSAVYCLGK